MDHEKVLAMKASPELDAMVAQALGEKSYVDFVDGKFVFDPDMPHYSENLRESIHLAVGRKLSIVQTANGEYYVGRFGDSGYADDIGAVDGFLHGVVVETDLAVAICKYIVLNTA